MDSLVRPEGVENRDRRRSARGWISWEEAARPHIS